MCWSSRWSGSAFGGGWDDAPTTLGRGSAGSAGGSRRGDRAAAARSVASSVAAAIGHAYSLVASTRPAAPSARRSGGSSSARSVAAANRSAVSATSRCVSSRTAMPSQPRLVDTIALPIASASTTFRRVPPPIRTGTATRVARSRYGRTSATSPVVVTPSRSRRRRSAGSPRPTIRSRAFGAPRRIRGQTSSTSQRAASRFGRYASRPLNTTSPGSGMRAAGMNASVSTPFGTTLTGVRGASARIISASRAEVTTTAAARCHAACSNRSSRVYSTRLERRRTRDASPACRRFATSYSMLCSSSTTGTPAGRGRAASTLDSSCTTSIRASRTIR